MLNKLQALKMLKDKVCECKKCPDLAANRTQIVFDNINYDEDYQLGKEGNFSAKIVLLGECPGRFEDEEGRPFVGPAGKLLDKMIASVGWNREDLYICNILKCLKLTQPNKEEANNCEGFLKLQLKVINPKIIICLGATAAQNLLKTDSSISQLRGKWFDYGKIKVICTYHPSYILRIEDPEKKKAAKIKVWSDLNEAVKMLNNLSEEK